jgi:glycosyltransferase involved in cell wall biosynthesis
MKILTVVFDLGKGGTQRAAQNFAEAYRAEGHDSRVLATRGGGVRASELAACGVPCWTAWSPTVARNLVDWQPDLIHVHSHGVHEATFRDVVANCPGARVVETNVFSRPSPWVDLVDVSFQLSSWCEWLYQRRTRNRYPSAILPNPVNTAAFERQSQSAVETFRLEHGIPLGAILLGRVGQSHESKWSSLLIETFDRVRAGGFDAYLLLVNPPEAIVACAAASRHAGRITVIDQIIGDIEMSVAYSAMDLFVHVADGGESFGLVLAEAMLCETPAVTLSTPWKDNSQGEVVGHNVGGIVATTRAGFIQAVIDLCGDPLRRATLGKQGRSRVLNRYDSRAVAKAAVSCDVSKSTWSPRNRISHGEVISQYRNACDSPSRLTCGLIGVIPRLQLTRYTSGYEPWSAFARRLGHAILNRIHRPRAESA